MNDPMPTFDVHELFPEPPKSEPAKPEIDAELIEAAKKAFTPKGFARLVVGSSVKFVVTSTIASIVPVESKKDKIKVLVGGYVISGLVAEQAKRYISDDLDEKFEFCKDVYEHVKKLTAAQNEAPADVPNP